MNKKYRCYVCKPQQAGEVMYLDYDGIHEIIGGFFDMLDCGTWAALVNDLGKINGLPMNRVIYQEYGIPVDIICGNIVCCGYDEEGEDRDLTDEELLEARLLFGEAESKEHLNETLAWMRSSEGRNERQAFNDEWIAGLKEAWGDFEVMTLEDPLFDDKEEE